MVKKKQNPPQDKEKEALRAENIDLRKRLGETEQHRNLLIETLHGLSKQAGAPRPLALTAAAVSPDDILNWLVITIETLTASRPVEGARTLSDLMVPIPRLVKLTNSKWFPNGGGFTDIPGTTSVGDLAESISQKLQQ